MNKRMIMAAAALVVFSTGSAVAVMNADASESRPQVAPAGPNAQPGARPAGVKGEPVSVVATAPKAATAAATVIPTCTGYAYVPFSEAGGVFGFGEVRCDQVVASITLRVSVVGSGFTAWATAQQPLLNTSYINLVAAGICPGSDGMATLIGVDIVTVDNQLLTASAVSATRPVC